LDQGELGVRTIRTEEMLTTPFTAWAEIALKSGNPVADETGCTAAGAKLGAEVTERGGSAEISVADRRRPAKMRPAMNPEASSANPTEALLSIGLRIVPRLTELREVL